jgi:hypothetical protein
MSQNHYEREYEGIKKNKNLPPVVKNRLIEDMEALMSPPNPDGFAVEFKCTDGQELAAADTKHDFKNIDMDIIKEILPSCSLSEGSDSSEPNDETKELNKILNYVMGEDNISDDSTRNILLSGGDLPKSSGMWSHPPRDDQVKNPIKGGHYYAFDLGNLRWDDKMSRIIQTIKGKPSADPILETIIKENTNKKINKVFIIDDIHSTSFIEDIKSQKDKVTDPFWCVLQLAQTIYDPAGKITPKTKPSIFNSPNIEFGWQDIRKEKTSGPIDTTSVFETETLNLLALSSNREIITDNITKLMLKNNAYLTISGNPLDYLSHKVSFMYKISDSEDKYAIFDNRSSAIKNRNYISTIIKDAMIGLGIKKKMSTKDGIKSHYIAKRIGDQGQANVCAEETISYIIEKDKDKFEARKTNGAHMFVSKDRLAIGSALLFNAPLILHLKAGKPKKDLHHILYIRNDLIEKETHETINNKIDAINKQVNELR